VGAGSVLGKVPYLRYLGEWSVGLDRLGPLRVRIL